MNIRKLLGRFIWTAGNRFQRLGCWIEGAHLVPIPLSKHYCLRCGLGKPYWKLKGVNF